MKIKFYTFEDNGLRLRISTIFASIFCLMLGINGIFNFINTSYYNSPNIKTYSIILIVFSMIAILISVLKCSSSNYESL